MKIPHIAISGRAPFEWKAEVVEDGKRTVIPFTSLSFEVASTNPHGTLVLVIPGELVQIDDDKELQLALDRCGIKVSIAGTKEGPPTPPER